MPPNREYWWSTKQPQVTDLRWQLGFQWHRRYWVSFQVTRLFHKATVSHCDHFLMLHMYLLFETSPGWLQGWRGFFFFLTSIWWGSTQLQCIYYLRRILISRPPRVFRVSNVVLVWFLTLNYHKSISFQWKKIQNECHQSNFHLPILSDLWLDGKLHENLRFCPVTQYYFTEMTLKMSLKSAWFFFWKPVLTMNRCCPFPAEVTHAGRINSLWPSDICWHRSGSTLAQIMACYLMAPSHYMSQCWLIISKIHW